MDYDRDKVDEMVLALLWLTPAGDGRAWKLVCAASNLLKLFRAGGVLEIA